MVTLLRHDIFFLKIPIFYFIKWLFSDEFPQCSVLSEPEMFEFLQPKFTALSHKLFYVLVSLQRSIFSHSRLVLVDDKTRVVGHITKPLLKSGGARIPRPDYGDTPIKHIRSIQKA